jgi:hypothetical protein
MIMWPSDGRRGVLGRVSELQPKKVYVKTAQNVLSRKMFKSM